MAKNLFVKARAEQKDLDRWNETAKVLGRDLSEMIRSALDALAKKAGVE